MSESLLQAGTLWWREITRFRRQRSRVIGSFLQPLVFWLLLGAGLKASFRPAGMPAGMDYFQYLYPGFIVLVLLFTAIFATISTVEDRREGFLQGRAGGADRAADDRDGAGAGRDHLSVGAELYLPGAGAAGGNQPEPRGDYDVGRNDGGDRFCADVHRVDYRVANRIDAGLSCDHESDPSADLAIVGGVLADDGRAGRAGMADAAESSDLWNGGAARMLCTSPIVRRWARCRACFSR